MAVQINMKVALSETELQADKSTVRSHVKLIAVDPQFDGAVFEARANGSAAALAYVAGNNVVVTIGNPTP